jgi:hypothetical protein
MTQQQNQSSILLEARDGLSPYSSSFRSNLTLFTFFRKQTLAQRAISVIVPIKQENF